DLEKDQAFSFGAWVKLPGRVSYGAIFARLDDQHDYRGWDLWVQNNRVGTHIIHKWPDDALKVMSQTPVQAGKWNHVFVTYDSSAQTKGVKVYINGVPQGTDVEASSLKNTIRTRVPLKLAQRHSASRMDNLLIQDMRIYGRALTGPEVSQL